MAQPLHAMSVQRLKILKNLEAEYKAFEYAFEYFAPWVPT